MNKVLTVSQLNNYVKNVFDDELLLQNITVEGEIYEVKFSGGNTYLTLKEDDYVLPCVKFGARYEFAIGDKVHVTGSMRFYPRGGRTTFVVTYASAVGKGELLVKFNELKDKLAKEGVFDNKKSLPRIIKRLAIVTSTEGAVIHDFLEVLTRNGCGYIDVDIYGVKVQGAGAEDTIVKAIVAAQSSEYDVVVVARGGGSGQDLGCFNTEVVARAVFNCRFPVISAIGHEVDFTLCDFASSLRAGTPSIAAEQIVRNNEAFIYRFYECMSAIKTRAEWLVSSAAARTKGLIFNLMLGCEQKTAELKSKISAGVDRIYRINGDNLDETERSCLSNLKLLRGSADALMSAREQELKFMSAMLDKSSPLKILSDGYARVMKDGAVVTTALGVNVGDNLKVVMSDGTLKVKVLNKE